MEHKKPVKNGWIYTTIFTLLSFLYIMPIVVVLINSFKRKTYINREPFRLPNEKTFEGLKNYVSGIEKIDFFSAFENSLFITICSVAVIILCTSMCAWYISRVKNKVSSGMYYMCAFSMIVPFQMVMFTLSKISDMLPVFESLIVKHGAKLQIKIYSLAFFSVENLIKNMKLMAGLLMQKTL